MSKLSPEELQEWIVLLVIERKWLWFFKEEPFEEADVHNYLGFLTGCLLALPDAAINSIVSSDELYMSEHHDTFTKYPIPLGTLLRSLIDRRVITYNHELGYVMAPAGKTRFRHLSERLRGYREVMVREKV